MHEDSTFQLDYRVGKCAHDLRDQELLKEFSAGDLIAQEAKYHSKCLAELYNRTRKLHSTTETISHHDTCHGITLADILTYIHESWDVDKIRCFKLSDFTELYTTRLEQLGIEITSRVHSTDLKHRLLMRIPEMKAFNKGRDVYLAFEDDVGKLLHASFSCDPDEENIF